MRLTVGKGNVTIQALGTDGNVTLLRRYQNMMVEDGRNALRDLLQGVGQAPDYIAAGQSTTATTDSMSALLAELFRVQCHSRRVMDNKAVYMATFGTETIQGHQAYDVGELGLFANCGGRVIDDEMEPHDGGTMYCRVTIAPIDLGDVDQINTIFVAWEIPLFAE